MADVAGFIDGVRTRCKAKRRTAQLAEGFPRAKLAEPGVAPMRQEFFGAPEMSVVKLGSAELKVTPTIGIVADEHCLQFCCRKSIATDALKSSATGKATSGRQQKLRQIRGQIAPFQRRLVPQR